MQDVESKPEMNILSIDPYLAINLGAVREH